MPFVVGREASLLLGAAAAASLGAAALYALNAGEGAKQSSCNGLPSVLGPHKAVDEQLVAGSSAVGAAPQHCQVTPPAAPVNGAVSVPAGDTPQPADATQPPQPVRWQTPAQSATSTQPEAAGGILNTHLHARSDSQQLETGSQPSIAHAEIQQGPQPGQHVHTPVQQEQEQQQRQQRQREQPGQVLPTAQQVLKPPHVQQPVDQNVKEQHHQEAPTLQQLQPSEPPQQHASEGQVAAQQLTHNPSKEDPSPEQQEQQQLEPEQQQGAEGGLAGQQPQQDASGLGGQLDQQQPQQSVTAATPPSPWHLQPQPSAALGPPSERDKAIMYRLSIDKSAWHEINSRRSSTAGDAAELGRLFADAASSAAESPATVVAGSSGGAASVIAAFERAMSRQASNSNPASPRSSTTSPKGSGGGRQRQVFNTARCQPSLDTTVSTAAVACSLAVQYADNSSLQGRESHQVVQSLSSSCAQLCKQHCSKLQDSARELGETTALDIGCGTGGCCFELALSFSHVLGIDGDAKHVVAAKEMKDKGQLEYSPVLQQDPAAAANGGARKLQQQVLGDVCLAKVAPNCDRDNVRFWCYPLPDLPPKLQPVDAVLIEDVEGRLASGLSRVCQQVPALLNPGGVCVVVLPGDSIDGQANGGCAAGVDGQQANGAVEAWQHGPPGRSHAAGVCTPDRSCHRSRIHSVRHWLEEHGLQFVAEQQLQYPVVGSIGPRSAVAGVWLQPK
eukprot:GHUV01003839.1.p1 GENE.GHUV01003839.1~~GHUV01003839.1.p1  ORF type:complete len:729 (+),score=300.56 GHUV01003839.1:151-2337(+)